MSTNFEEIETNEQKSNLADRITSLRLIATDFERRITGYRQLETGTKWVYTGDVLVGSETATRLTGFLQSFCNEINLISENKMEDLAWERFNNVETMLDGTLLDPYCEDDYNTVIELFKNAITRILRVIGTSKEMFNKFFNNGNEEEKMERTI